MLKVFLVEDDPVFAGLVKAMLQKKPSWELHHFSRGKNAMDALGERPDIVILDYKLPDYSGIELMKKIKGFSEAVRAIIVSAQQDVGVVVEAYKSGVDDYIVKGESCLPELENSIRNLSSSVVLQREVDRLRDELID